MGCFDNIDEFREEKRYLRKDSTLGVRDMYSNLWKEYINRYGVQTTYYRHGYKLDTQDDFIYGEDPTEPFHDPININMVVEYQTDALLLSKFGLETNADLTAVVSIKDYQDRIGFKIEPKPGDVIELTEAGWLSSEMPMSISAEEHILAKYNVVYDVDSLNIEILTGIDIAFEHLIPVKRDITETVLSHSIPMYSTNTSITSNKYPIVQDLLPITGHVISANFIRMHIDDSEYFIPLYTPIEDITMPTIHSLFFNYDIVKLNSEDVTDAGYFPFEYQNTTLLMPLYNYSTSAIPIPPTVIVASGDLSSIDLDAKTLLCKYQDSEYVSSILLELSAVYGATHIRYPHLFEITEVKYQDMQGGMNVGQGHYVWKIHAKRFDYSFEPNAPKEGDFDQVYDNSFFGTLSSFENEPSPEKTYPQEIEEVSEEVWDYNEKGTDTGPYGYY